MQDTALTSLQLLVSNEALKKPLFGLRIIQNTFMQSVRDAHRFIVIDDGSYSKRLILVFYNMCCLNEILKQRSLQAILCLSTK
jgi:hypothetical protein